MDPRVKPAGDGREWVSAESIQTVTAFLARRRVDRRSTIGATLRHAVVERALVEHRVGKPDPAADDEDQEQQQHRIGDPTVARGLLAHVRIITRGSRRRKERRRGPRRPTRYGGHLLLPCTPPTFSS